MYVSVCDRIGEIAKTPRNRSRESEKGRNWVNDLIHVCVRVSSFRYIIWFIYNI